VWPSRNAKRFGQVVAWCREQIAKLLEAVARQKRHCRERTGNGVRISPKYKVRTGGHAIGNWRALPELHDHCFRVSTLSAFKYAFIFTRLLGRINTRQKQR
jgi:hypothetical protein